MKQCCILVIRSHKYSLKMKLYKIFLSIRQHFCIETKILYTMIIPFLALPFLPELSIWFSARWSCCANDWCVVNSADASENRANVASYIADVFTLYTVSILSIRQRKTVKIFSEKSSLVSVSERWSNSQTSHWVL